MNELNSKTLAVNDLSENLVKEMSSLYLRYYKGTYEYIFLEDLKQKTHVILVYDEEKLVGFSALAIYKKTFQDELLNIIYSGDTIIENSHWGKQTLAFHWLKFAGNLKKLEPSLPLYWLLLSKGHRIYRYLNVFSREYYPSPTAPTPFKIQQLMDELAFERFGEAYCAKIGKVIFDPPRGYLDPLWANIPEKDLKRREVQFFLEHNPGFSKGEELVCLTELSDLTLKPMAARIFNSE